MHYTLEPTRNDHWVTILIHELHTLDAQIDTLRLTNHNGDTDHRCNHDKLLGKLEEKREFLIGLIGECVGRK